MCKSINSRLLDRSQSARGACISTQYVHVCCCSLHIPTHTNGNRHGCCEIVYLSAAIANLGVSIHFPGVMQININIAIHCLINMYNNCIKGKIIYIHHYVVGALLHTRCFTQSREQNLRSNFEKGTTPARGRPHQLHVPALNKGEDQTALLQQHKQGRTCTSAGRMKGTQAHAELGTQQLLFTAPVHTLYLDNMDVAVGVDCRILLSAARALCKGSSQIRMSGVSGHAPHASQNTPGSS